MSFRNLIRNILESFISRRPRSDCLSVPRNNLKFTKSRLFPQARLKQNGYNLYFTTLQSGHAFSTSTPKQYSEARNSALNQKQD